jgi:hypothetical protein
MAFLRFFLLRELAQKLLYKKVDLLNLEADLLSHILGQCGAFAYPESMSWAGERCVSL